MDFRVSFTVFAIFYLVTILILCVSLGKVTPRSYSPDAVLMVTRTMKGERFECYWSRGRECLVLSVEKGIRWDQRRTPGGGDGTCTGL